MLVPDSLTGCVRKDSSAFAKGRSGEDCIRGRENPTPPTPNTTRRHCQQPKLNSSPAIHKQRPQLFLVSAGSTMLQSSPGGAFPVGWTYWTCERVSPGDTRQGCASGGGSYLSSRAGRRRYVQRVVFIFLAVACVFAPVAQATVEQIAITGVVTNAVRSAAAAAAIVRLSDCGNS